MLVKIVNNEIKLCISESDEHSALVKEIYLKDAYIRDAGIQGNLVSSNSLNEILEERRVMEYKPSFANGQFEKKYNSMHFSYVKILSNDSNEIKVIAYDTNPNECIFETFAEYVNTHKNYSTIDQIYNPKLFDECDFMQEIYYPNTRDYELKYFKVTPVGILDIEEDILYKAYDSLENFTLRFKGNEESCNYVKNIKEYKSILETEMYKKISTDALRIIDGLQIDVIDQYACEVQNFLEQYKMNFISSEYSKQSHIRYDNTETGNHSVVSYPIFARFCDMMDILYSVKIKLDENESYGKFTLIDDTLKSYYLNNIQSLVYEIYIHALSWDNKGK